MPRTERELLINAQTGTPSGSTSFGADIMTSNRIIVTTATAGSACVLDIKTDSLVVKTHTFTSAELTAKGAVIDLDGYSFQNIEVAITTNTGMGAITVKYQGSTN